MLQDLLNQLKNGGLTIEVIDVNDLADAIDPDNPVVQASKLMDWIIEAEKTVRTMHHLIADCSQMDRAEQLRRWWVDLNQPLADLSADIPEGEDSSDHEKNIAMIERIKATAEPIVERGRSVLDEIKQRQRQAIADTDISDLIS